MPDEDDSRRAAQRLKDSKTLRVAPRDKASWVEITT
jgi:hypothetical protein